MEGLTPVFPGLGPWLTSPEEAWTFIQVGGSQSSGFFFFFFHFLMMKSVQGHKGGEKNKPASIEFYSDSTHLEASVQSMAGPVSSPPLTRQRI